MKSNTFNYSLLAIGVAAVLGLSTAASAVETPLTTTGVDISNQATASYSVDGQAQPEAKSNIVKVSVSQQVRFSLTADSDDTAQGGALNDDKNEKIAVTPNGFVLFEHTLKNTGNTTDTYDITVGATDPKYTQNASTVTYTVYEADGITPVAGRTNITVTYTENTLLPSELTKGQSVKFTIRAKTSGNKGNETLPLQLSVTSRNLAGVAGATKTLTNTDTSFTRLPTFGIVKTITNGLDLNNANDTAQYQIVVTNQSTAFSADATEVNIADFLPAGLVLAVPLTTTNITASSTATVGTIVANSAGDSGFNVTGNTIPVGQSITFLFTVKKGGTGTLNPATAINHVTVTDDLDNDTATDNTLVDSTDTSRELFVSNFYPTAEINNLNGQTPANTGDDSTLPLSLGGTIQRALTLTGPTIKEIAPVTGLTSTDNAGQVTHATVITNTGKDVEGSQRGELTFTITDNDGTAPDAVNVVPGTVKVTYNPNDGTGVQTAQVITAVGGVYDINTVLTAGVKAGGTVTITYNVSANNAPLFNPVTSTADADATFENTIVTLIPGLEGAPTPLIVTDKTTVRGLVLVKKQAIAADCAATSTGIVGSFVTADITGALPGQCIVYQIQARNTFTPSAASFPITNITILDEFSKFSANADYVVGSLADLDGVEAETTTNVTTTVATLAAQGTATMQFKVKIKPGL